MTLEFALCLAFIVVILIGFIVIDYTMDKEAKEKERKEQMKLAIEFAKEIKEHV